MLSDVVIIGIVLGLIFAAVSYYLYSRVGQLERKVGLMENILLDLKVTTEQALISATEPENMQPLPRNEFVSTSPPEEVEVSEEMREVNIEKSTRSTSTKQRVQVDRSSVSVNFEAMTYKELVQLAKQKNISGTRNLSKSQVIDMIRRHDSGDSSEEQQEEGTDLTELLSAQPENGGASLNDLEIDNTLE